MPRGRRRKKEKGKGPASEGSFLHHCHCAALTISRLQPQKCGKQPGSHRPARLTSPPLSLGMPVGRHCPVRPNPAGGTLRRPKPRPGRAAGEGLLTHQVHVSSADAEVGPASSTLTAHPDAGQITIADAPHGRHLPTSETLDHAASSVMAGGRVRWWLPLGTSAAYRGRTRPVAHDADDAR